MKAAFFDLDRTLVRVNTAPLYVRWRIRQGQLRWLDMARVTWWGMRYSLGLLDAVRASERAVSTLRGVEERSFRDECARWVKRDVLPLVTDRARREVERRREQGHQLAVLTTTTPYIAEPIAEALNIEHVLCSRMEVEAGRFTGRLASPLCFGPAKVHRARAWCEQHRVDLAASVFYTDSVSDLPMLEAVAEPRVI
ncbi:MAG TPA: HAD-IB family hydrolase, partial [Polyangiaceae bacterium]|nr:HAD-IB family hydrolase [Polyangiaceae bacterium]